ncbi:MAG: BREX-1 system phosphatase PglZ type A, partial [Saprospiraceae bacterium]
MTKIKAALEKRFKKHRVLFWYDDKEEFREQFEELSIKNVEKIQVAGNEFAIKYRIHKIAPQQHFLLYFTTPKPANEENWLLDMELAYDVFYTDQQALFLQELGLGYHFKELVGEHFLFFKNKERLEKLKELLDGDETERALKYKILAVVFKTKYTNLETYIHAHGTACADGDDGFDKELERYQLADFYWKEIASRYNYEKETPSIYDFLIEIFNHNSTFGEKTNLKKEANYLLSLWKDTVQYRPSFGKISTKIAKDIDVEGQLQTATIDELIQEDAFKIIDYKLIGELVQLITGETMASEKVLKYIKQRENKFWYSDFKFLYQSLQYATEIIALVRQYGQQQYASFDEGTQHYSSTLQEIDYTYRKFIWNYRQTNQDRILAELAEKVEKIYATDWLLTYNDNWQKVVDKLVEWPTQTRKSQQRFFLTNVQPILAKKQRVFVVISDALRYECGVELTKMLQGENRLQASADYMISSLPSYTQLGMASLLPHKKLTVKAQSDTIMADGLSSIGVAGRTKILATNSGVRATAIRAEEFMKMNAAKEGRAFVKQYDLIYIYHNQIDAAGDNTKSEDKVFEAVESELQFLVEVTKKVA